MVQVQAQNEDPKDPLRTSSFAEVKTKFNAPMHILRSENAKEYMSIISVQHEMTWDSPPDNLCSDNLSKWSF